MAQPPLKRDRLIYGVLLPIGAMIAGLFIVMLSPTGASAAGFSALAILVGSIVSTPIVLIINGLVAFQYDDQPRGYFKRGMIAPGIVVIGAIVYQTGLWDAIT